MANVSFNIPHCIHYLVIESFTIQCITLKGDNFYSLISVIKPTFEVRVPNLSDFQVLCYWCIWYNNDIMIPKHNTDNYKNIT